MADGVTGPSAAQGSARAASVAAPFAFPNAAAHAAPVDKVARKRETPIDISQDGKELATKLQALFKEGSLLHKLLRDGEKAPRSKATRWLGLRAGTSSR